MSLSNNTEFKHVRIRVHKKLLPKFLNSLPRGFDVTIYPVAKYQDESNRDMTFNVTNRFPDPTCRRTKEDIDRFLTTLSNIDPRIKLLSDKITKKDQPDLLERPTIKIETLLEQPNLVDDPDMQNFISKARNVREVEIRQGQIKGLQQRYEQYKEQFIKTKFHRGAFKDTKKRTEETNEKIYKTIQGEI